MPLHRPHPSEELNTGPEAPARTAASVIVLRDSQAGPEVLLVQRNPAARFMGGAWVFPGGAQDGDEPLTAVALRELEEEAAITASEHDLVPFSRWITPAEVKVRFDTWFYVMRAPADADPRVDGRECVGLRWATARQALDDSQRGELQLVFPTIKHLEQLDGFEDVDAVIAHARSREVRPVQPRIVTVDGTRKVLLPGEPGFE